MSALRCLVVLAHPVPHSLAARLAALVAAQAGAAGWDVRHCDLYARGFDPNLSKPERESYYSDFHGEAARELEELAWAEVIVLVFPTWWFGFPAILKGWFDRVWAPGLAYDHAPAYGPMIPRLHGLRAVLAVTTMGAPWWVETLVMRRPLQRILRLGIVRPCAPRARVIWRALHRAEAVEPDRLKRFEAGLRATLAELDRRLR
ncbi:NAD(P)H-dependent oxidoreductase [Rhodobacter sp. Har01]|uniref:NAD(P)H-dependent oxidoreductase n=1 Tax=Rhodobacter sp. Har01 TaxID=2883999 RepID=UPI001D061F8A|nr:NAD(P)H-dependent oxidoreductase [Rhodobacter sp. Har01]MCB6177430.1 NAD(P)H-dependent oxidoreductase [Rhodobacter sp. Har01]